MLEDLSIYGELMEKCSNCVFCQATCPAYLAEILETEAARSRMMLIRAALVDQTLPLTPRIRKILDHCLLCGNCGRTCPVGAAVDEMVIAARHHLYKGRRMALTKRMLLKQIMEERGLKGALKRIDALAKRLGLSPREIPKLPKQSFNDRFTEPLYEANGTPRATVAYFVGCATNAIYPDTAAAVMHVLAANNIRVLLPQDIVCCGIPALAQGDIKTARQMMAANVTALARLDADAVVTDCTSCGLLLKEKMLKVISKDDPLYATAAAVSSKVRDVTAFLEEIGLTAPQKKVSLKYTCHIPCHAHWEDRSEHISRDLLNKIPGADHVEMDYPERCCGAGGIFFVEQPELAARIRAPKIDDIRRTGADVVITRCPSCRSYLHSGLDGAPAVTHPMILLAKSYGVEPV